MELCLWEMNSVPRAAANSNRVCFKQKFTSHITISSSCREILVELQSVLLPTQRKETNQAMTFIAPAGFSAYFFSTAGQRTTRETVTHEVPALPVED
jgi:hypothetical protein